MKKTRKVLLALMMPVLLVAMASCGNGDRSKEKTRNTSVFVPKLDTEREVSLNVLGTYGNFEALEKVFADFNQIYPNVNLTYEYTDSQLTTATNRFVTNNNMDILFINTSNADFLYKDLAKKYFVDFKELEGFDLSYVDPRILAAAEFDGGSIFMMPIYFQTTGVLVNVSLLTEYGLPIPHTLSELAFSCDRFVANEITPLFVSDATTGILFLNHVIRGVLDRPANERSTILKQLEEGVLPTEILEDSLKVISQWKGKGYFDNGGNDITDTYNGLIMKFLEGKIPYMPCFNSDNISGVKKREQKSEYFKEHPFEYTYIPSPTGKRGPENTYRLEIFFGISKNSPNQDYATEFMRFLYTENEVYTMTTVKGMPSILQDSGDSRIVEFDKLKPEQVSYTGNGEISPYVYNCLYKTMRDIVALKSNPQKIAERYSEYMKAYENREKVSKEEN